MTGDISYELYTYNGTTGDTFMNLMQPSVSRMPFMVVPGNHEYYTSAQAE